MAVERRAGAPKLIEWTGERFVPWSDDVQVAYEHYHRYTWAAQLTKGRRVLDLGSGEGFGSAILAAEAASVQGIDIDERAVSHSQLNYQAPHLEFRIGSATQLDAFDAGSFDVVVAFEVLEHLVEQERMLEEIDRVLAPDGVLLISTPDRRVYSQATGQDNPFHEHELTESEFRKLLGARFSHVGLWGQRTICGSRLAALDADAGERPLTVFLERSGDEWRQAGEPAPMYLIAVASRVAQELPSGESTLVDYGIQLVRQHEGAAVLARAEADNLGRQLRDTRAQFAAEIKSLLDATRKQRAELERVGAQLGGAVTEIQKRDAQLAVAQASIARVEASVAWSAVQFVRWHVYQTIGEHSLPARALQAVLRGALRLRRLRRAVPAAPEPVAPRAISPIIFPLYAEPLVSIVIPAHTGAELTEACLRAIAVNTSAPTYEVIVVDDADDAGNRRLWASLEGAQVVVNSENLGYLRSVNAGASRARGRYVVPLNNDTVVQPGWLEALTSRAEHDLEVGIVAPMLLYRDGSLQEAGGIIFQDGSGWNYGRGQDPNAYVFQCVRDIDYGSGACLLVRADLWRELGGYDELYLPMYYEDTDLCFAARDLGYRVVYEPTARVVHVEGGTAGTDERAGGKRHQELNRPKFVEKWRSQLEHEQLPATPENVRRASNRIRRPHVLVVDHRVPWPDRDSGSLRMNHILGCLVEIGCRVTFIPDNLSPTEPYTRDLQQIGVEVIYGAADIGLELESMGPDLSLAIVSRPVIAPRYIDSLREHAPGATIAYDTVDLHFVREERRAALEGGSRVKAATLREIELGLIRATDVTVVVSEEERDIVVSCVPSAKVAVIPNANVIADTVAGPQSRSGVIFVGSFEHPPNTGAAVTLVRSVMPLVWRELGPIGVKIVGTRPPEDVLELAGDDVEITGWVKDLTSLYESARVMVAPLRYGAGMKGKVTQSLAAGLPIVTTPFGAEGLDAVDGQDMMIASDPAELAARIVVLMRDDELWSSMSQAGQDLVARVCSPEIMRQRLEELLGVSVIAP